MENSKKKYKGIWKSFFHMLYESGLPYGKLAVTLVLNMVVAWLGLLMPDMISGLVTDVSETLLHSIFKVGILSVCFGMIAVVMKYLAWYGIDRNMQRLAVRKIFYLRMDDIGKQDPRELVTRVTTDTKLLSELLVTIAVDEGPRLYFMIAALIKIFKNYNTTLGLVMLLSVPVTFFISWVVGVFTFGKADMAQTAVSKLTAKIGEKVNNMPIIKSYNNQEYEVKSGDEVIKDLERALKKKAFITRIGEGMKTVSTLIPTTTVIAIGAAMVLSGKVETASFVAYYSLAGTFIGYVVAHLTLWVLVKNSQGATYRLSKILELPDERTAENRQGKTGDIEFKDVTKKFGDHMVLDHASFTIEAGKKTAFVGFSGSGKSTALNLIEQFYHPDSGEIRMGGEPVTDYDLTSYRSLFSYVPQNAPGFSGTIRDILTYGKQNAISDEVLWEALEKADATAFVRLLGGLDYEVGNRAEKLSGGQKQKLSMARAMLSETDIMLLDEATSALDIVATEKIQNALDEKMRGKTMVLVAHNISTVINADKIIVFDGGKVIAEGTHQTLSETCSLYQELASLQKEA